MRKFTQQLFQGAVASPGSIARCDAGFRHFFNRHDLKLPDWQQQSTATFHRWAFPTPKGEVY
jgi:hypothetical protein